MENKKSYIQLEKDYEVLRRVHNNLVVAVERINIEMEALRNDNIFFKDQLANADQRVVISKEIVANNIKQMTEENNALVEEIVELKKEIKILKAKV